MAPSSQADNQNTAQNAAAAALLVCPEPDQAPWLWPAGISRTKSGELSFAAGVNISEIAQNFPTPTYLFDLDTFAKRAAEISQAMNQAFHQHQGMSGASVYYAGKAFICTTLGPILKRFGIGLDTASLGELSCALNPACAIDPGVIGLHGNNKDPRAIKLGLKSGIGRIIIDSLVEIEQLDQLAAEIGGIAPVMVRLTTGVHAGGHEFIATAHEDQKFGLSLASGQAAQAVEQIMAAKHLKLIGLHSHIGSQIADVAAFAVAAQRVMKFRAEMMRTHQIEIPEVDLGGGLAISYQGERPPSAQDYAQGLAEAIREACQEAKSDIPHISIEPGRWLAGPSCVTVYRVGVIKDVSLEDGGTRRYVSVDGGMSDNIRPILYQAGYTATLANRSSEAHLVECRVVGSHCESGDILIPSVGLPADLEAGDLLVIPATGAYGRAMASNYNWFTRPGVLGISQDWETAGPKTRWIYRPETVADLLAADPFAR